MELHARQARADFAAAVNRREEEIDLFGTCLVVAAEEYPELDRTSYTDRLANLASIADGHLGSNPDLYDRLDAVRKTLFADAGFKGNSIPEVLASLRASVMLAPVGFREAACRASERRATGGRRVRVA